MAGYFDTDDWKKQAAVTATSDADIEKAFADQAAGFVENKLPALMKGEHNIGFEIVKKNDDNTRMIGIFAFKIEKSLLYAVVFFLNGDIKGPMLYRCDTKTFVPATKEWATYLVSALERKVGEGVSRNKRDASSPWVRMDKITMVPGVSKRASYQEDMHLPVHWHKGVPVPTPEGTCTVVLKGKGPDPMKVSWDGKTPGGFTLLKVAFAADGTVRCKVDNVEEFCLEKKDAELFDKSASAVAIEGPDDLFFELDGVSKARMYDTFIKKQAFVEDANAQFDAICKAMSWATEGKGLIREFLNEKDYGAPATDSIMKAASSNYEFAEMLMDIYKTPENLIPAKFNQTEKAAAAVSQVGFVNDLGVFSDGRTSAPPQFYEDGFFMYDTRQPEEKSLIVKDTPSEVSTISQPGIYSIVKSDGSMEHNVFATIYAGKIPNHDSRDAYMSAHPIYHEWSDKTDVSPTVILVKDGKIMSAFADNILGVRTGEWEDYEGLRNGVETHKAYMPVHDGRIFDPIFIDSKSTVDGIHTISCLTPSFYENDIAAGADGRMHIWSDETTEYTQNKELRKSDLPSQVFGVDMYFIPIDYTSVEGSLFSSTDRTKRIQLSLLKGIGSASTMQNFIMDKWDIPHVSVTRDENGNKRKYHVEADGEKSAAMSKKSMMKKLAVDMGIDGTEVYRIMSEVDRKGSSSFYFQAHEKIASHLRLVDRPVFQDEFDSDFGITMSPMQTFKLGVEGDQVYSPASSIGDAWNPTSASGLPDSTVLSSDPADLQPLADTYKLPNVFEHGVVGTLANAFNAMPLVDKYVAKLEDGVDVLGRLKFLIHWCPQNFTKAYGADDMVNLEAQVDENYNSLGDLLLNLLQKTERQRLGDPDKMDKDHD